MSTETENTPEPDQDNGITSEKKERNHNGIYRRNTRLKKNTKKEETPSDNPENSKAEIKILKPRFKKSELETNTAKKEVATKGKSKAKKVSTEKIEEVSAQDNVITGSNISQDLNNSEESFTNNPTENITENEPEIKSNNEIPQVEEPVVTVRSAFHELLYLIRQKNAYNHNEFFLELDKVLEIMPFESIKESNLTLFGFACMYDREIIFQKLCQDYSEFINQQDLESILKICFTKREETVGNLIKTYKERFKPSGQFIQELFVSMSISSYREGNNFQILNWLAEYLTEAEYEVFWNKCIEYRNVSLMNTALHIASIKDNLKNNISKYSNGFKSIGREHTIALALNREYRQIQVTPINNTLATLVKKTSNSENVETIKNVQTEDEVKATSVVFKNVRKGSEQ